MFFAGNMCERHATITLHLRAVGLPIQLRCSSRISSAISFYNAETTVLGKGGKEAEVAEPRLRPILWTKLRLISYLPAVPSGCAVKRMAPMSQKYVSRTSPISTSIAAHDACHCESVNRVSEDESSPNAGTCGRRI